MKTNGHNPHHVHINIADFVVALETDDATVAERTRERYHEFLAQPEETPLISLTLKVIPDALFIEPAPGPWIIESSYANNQITYKSYLEQGQVDLETGQGVIEMAPNANVENVLRVVYAWLCLKHDALLLHAAGVIRDGQGYVFFGPSGAGKTTTTRLAAKTAHVVSDDIVVVRFHEGSCRLYGVPFRGELSEAPRANQQAPLKGLFRLRQDTAHYVEPMSHIKAVAELVASAPFVVKDLTLSDQLIAVCNRIARATPVQQLHFKRDDGFWEVVNG